MNIVTLILSMLITHIKANIYVFTFLKLYVCLTFLQKEFWISLLITPLKTFDRAV